MLKLAEALTEGGRFAVPDAGREALHGLRASGGVAGRQRRHLGRREDVAASAQRQVDGRVARVRPEAEQVHAARAGPARSTSTRSAALANGKIAMAHLSGARTIGYIEKYAPENMRDPEHFMPLLRPHGPSGQGRHLRARRRELGRLQPVEVPERGLRVPAPLLQEGALPGRTATRCRSTSRPIFKSMLNDPAYLANERIKKWKPWHDVHGDRAARQALPAHRLQPARGQPAALPGRARRLGHRGRHGGGGHGGRQEPEGGGRPRAEARRGAPDPARPKRWS